jgi:hypothetical protein
MDPIPEFTPFRKIFELHGGTCIKHDVRSQVGLFLVLLHIKTLFLGIHLPVNVLEIISGVIGPVLSKLHTEPVERTFMQSGYESFHDLLGAKLKGG